MTWAPRRAAVIVAVVVGVVGAIAAVTPRGRASSVPLPARLTDQEFWRIVTAASEPDGYFRSDNFLSNEINFQRVIPALTVKLGPGIAYVGVGPEQNFTYMAAFRPAIAFVVDIRRQNLLEHLLYKAFFETSANRVEFLSRLFARARPAASGVNASARELLDAYAAAEPSEKLFNENLAAALDRLQRVHGFTLTDEDRRRVEKVYGAFFTGGVELTYGFIGGYGYGRGRMPTYADLMTAADDRGVARSYLASEENFQTIKRLEAANLIVPVVGDFAGPKALRAVGDYLREHGATVGVFYTSNVEQYLFQDPSNWRKFFANVATMPIDARSTFIRSVSGAWQPNPGFGRSSPMLCSIEDLLAAFRQNRIASYADVIALSR